MNDPVDLLQIKIEQAKRKLPEETLNAIAAVDWQAVIIGMREKKGYSFEQLGDLETETELLLAGLLSPADYPKELARRMGISKAQTDELVNEMNDLVFKRIKEELIKNTERKKIFAKKLTAEANDTQVLSAHGIEIIPARSAYSTAVAGGTKPDLTLPELNSPLEEYLKGEVDKSIHPGASATPQEGNKETVHPILAQKISGSFQIPVVKTEHSLENITKTTSETQTPGPRAPKVYPKNGDPYRINPNE